MLHKFYNIIDLQIYIKMLKIYILILIIIAINIVNGDIIKRGFGCPLYYVKIYLKIFYIFYKVIAYKVNDSM